MTILDKRKGKYHFKLHKIVRAKAMSRHTEFRHPHICLSKHPSIHPSDHPSVHSSIYPFIHLLSLLVNILFIRSVFMWAYLCVWHSVWCPEQMSQYNFASFPPNGFVFQCLNFINLTKKMTFQSQTRRTILSSLFIHLFLTLHRVNRPSLSFLIEI